MTDKPNPVMEFIEALARSDYAFDNGDETPMRPEHAREVLDLIRKPPSRLLTKKEFTALAVLVKDYSTIHGEDMVAGLLLSGAYLYLPRDGVVVLAKRLEAALPSKPSRSVS